MAETRTIELDDPDAFGAIRYDLTFFDNAGRIVDEAVATRWSAEGYDRSGARVFGAHGEAPAPSADDVARGGS